MSLLNVPLLHEGFVKKSIILNMLSQITTYREYIIAGMYLNKFITLKSLKIIFKDPKED